MLRCIFRKDATLALQIGGLIITLIVFSSGCTIPFQGETYRAESTLAALSALATSKALQATQEAVNLQSTANAIQSTQLAFAAQPTVFPTIAVTPTNNAPQPEVSPSALPENLNTKIRGAKILLFEDISGNNLGLYRYVKESLDSGGYVYTDVGSAQGWFKDQLTDKTGWDLIIASSELSGRIQGEYYEYLIDQVNNGTALIMEAWNLDAISQGKVRNMMDLCGIDFYADWYNPPSRSIWYLVPDHPILNDPNPTGPSLRNFSNLWKGDIGDLLEIKYHNNQPVGDATLIAGTVIKNTTTHGTLATCVGGRVVWQSFGSHEYPRETMTLLWQNYIYNTLKNHFLYTGVE